MAQVTVDYEEFAALKKREADYEKMVEDLKKKKSRVERYSQGDYPSTSG